MNGVNYLTKYNVVKGSAKYFYKCASCGLDVYANQELESITCEDCGGDMPIYSCELSLIAKMAPRHIDNSPGYCEHCFKNNVHLIKAHINGRWMHICDDCSRQRHLSSYWKGTKNSYDM